MGHSVCGLSISNIMIKKKKSRSVPMLSPSLGIETFHASLGCKARPMPEEEEALARPNWP